MGLRISTNILSLNVQRNLATTTRALQRSMRRLASGNRINTGRDDPAGLAMASGLESQRRGLLQAVRNLNDSRGFLETADGAMAEQVNMVQRMRELAVQASNGTLNNATRQYLDSEFQALLSEFTRLTTQTQFNGVNLLDGSFITTQIQVGSQKGQRIEVALTSMQSTQVFQPGTTTTYLGQGTFQTRATGFADPGVATMTSTDLNGDGKLDLVTGDIISNTLSLYLGNGNGTFNARTTVATTAYPYWVSSGDLNGDGFVDLISATAGANAVAILLGNGDGTFKTRTTVAAGTYPRSAKVVDLNGDGKLDIVSSDSNSNTLSIFLGNGNGTFAVRTTTATGNSPRDTSFGDLNGDGKIDLLAEDSGDSTVSVFLGNGNGTFTTRTTVSVDSSPVDIASADFNGDGYIDLVTTNFGGTDFSVALGNGNGTFKTVANYSTGSNPKSVFIGDFNGDGKLDLVAPSSGASDLSLLLGNGNGSFQARTTVLTGSNPAFAIGGDFNGDGVLDLASTSNNAINVSLQNSTSTINTNPFSLSTQSNAQNSLSIVDAALNYINSARANIGALQSRLDFATSVNMNTVENIAAARSQIMDTDMAAETAEFARLQILQRAGIAVLGQANMNSNLSLKLLENL